MSQMGREFAASFACALPAKSERPHCARLERHFWNDVEKMDATVAANPRVLDHQMGFNQRSRLRFYGWIQTFKNGTLYRSIDIDK
jgi:hypothetical protein